MHDSWVHRIDNTYRVETPEGIPMQAELAGVIPRAAAYLIDLLLRLSVMLGIIFVGLYLGQIGQGLILLSWFVIEWGYPVFFEVLRNGQTPGKKTMNLVAMNDDLTPVSWRTSALRNLLRAADMLPIGYLFGAATMILSSRFQRLGDLVAGTVVVHKAQELPAVGLPKVDAMIPNMDLSPDDRRALVAFVQRYDSMTSERADELANILSAATNKSGQANTQHLYGIGKWLLGIKPKGNEH